MTIILSRGFSAPQSMLITETFIDKIATCQVG